MFLKHCVATIGLVLMVLAPSKGFAQFGRAPDGEAAEVAQKVIEQNLAGDDCSLVIEARRLDDGSIRAECNNGETLRIFTQDGEGFAMRCSTARQLGISGC